MWRHRFVSCGVSCGSPLCFFRFSANPFLLGRGVASLSFGKLLILFLGGYGGPDLLFFRFGTVPARLFFRGGKSWIKKKHKKVNVRSLAFERGRALVPVYTTCGGVSFRAATRE